MTPKYIVPVQSPDEQQGDELEIYADSPEEAMAKANALVKEGVVISGNLEAKTPRLA